ncbi:MAG TPA: GlsB/YeaQ/YmgE family stress response membrane protein [Patescibacteria group bacterium]|nr:GlsB/YeaQ/YmgE family stress response membrane protein [Patescibacteria group bacterium]
MGILSWIILGLIAGWIASVLAGTNARQGLMGNILLGIFGALIGGFVMSILGFGGINDFDLYSIGVATLGATLLLWARRAIA